MAFPATALASMPEIRFWWVGDANQNGEYNYSTTEMREGSSVNTSNEWGDVVVGHHLTGPYGATPFPAIYLHFKHNGSGYAEANLTTERANTGHEPTSPEERDAGKFIQASKASLHFSAPGFVDNGIQVKLVHESGRSSRAVKIQDYRSDYGRYAFSYSIPTKDFERSRFNFEKVKSVTFFVDKKTEAGESTLTLMNIFFQRGAQ